jgi:hypothetical protein
MTEAGSADFSSAQPASKLIGPLFHSMKTRCLFLFVIFLVCFGAKAQQMPGDPVPVLRLVPSSRQVHVQSYPQAPGTTVDFAGTALMPKAHGTAKVEPFRGELKVELRLEDLGPAPQVDPAYLTYVLWAIPMNQEPQNLGELVLSGDESKLTTFTNLPMFAMVVTAEPYFAVKQPSSLIVLQNILRTPPDDPNVLRADLLSLRMDSKTPLDIYEARNAVRIARLAGAEHYAAEPFHKALQLLQQAEGIFARKKGQDIPDVKEKARQATQAAEEARSAAAEREGQSTP